MTNAGGILPQAYFDGLSTLWGGCAYIGSAIVTAGLVFQAVRTRPEPGPYVWLFAKILFIALTTAFLREWLMRLNDIVVAFGAMMGIDPTAVDARFVQFVAGKTNAQAHASTWDVIWGTKSIGTAMCYAFLWAVGWVAWAVQYVVKLVGGILLTSGWALSPIFLAFFMIRPMVGVAQKYLLGLVALVCWPFGWVIAAVVTNAMLDAAATASLTPVAMSDATLTMPMITVLLIGGWMLISSILAPYITTKILLMGINPAAALAEGIGGVGQAAFAGGIGAAVAAGTGGMGAGGVAALAAVGTLASGTESAVRGGNSARTSSAAVTGLSGFSSGKNIRRQTAAAEATADAASRRADAAESMASAFSEHNRNSKSGFHEQPHESDPNQAAIDIS